LSAPKKLIFFEKYHRAKIVKNPKMSFMVPDITEQTSLSTEKDGPSGKHIFKIILHYLLDFLIVNIMLLAKNISRNLFQYCLVDIVLAMIRVLWMSFV